MLLVVAVAAFTVPAGWGLSGVKPGTAWGATSSGGSLTNAPSAAVFPRLVSEADQFSHASLGVDGSFGPEANGLLEIPQSGKLFDEGFHCDLLGGTVHLAMLRVFLQAKIALAKVAPRYGLSSKRLHAG